MNAIRRRNLLNIYAALMEEIKARISWIDGAIDQATKWPDPAAFHEFGYLQLRMICETIALACLVAHGDLDIVKAFQKEYAADRIIRRLDKLHPNFYPHPRTTTILDSGQYQLNIVEEGDFLKKKELIELYAKCGLVLHRGSLKTLNVGRRQVKPGFSDIKGTLKKFEELLSCHAMFLFAVSSPKCNGAA
jgi:hypothetical protein